MGKKRDNQSEEDSVLESPPGSAHKKHKKHKKHKHKHKRGPDEEDDVGEINVTDDSNAIKPAIKLKIKIGGQTLGTTSVDKTTILEKSESSNETSVPDVVVPWDRDGDPAIKAKKDGEDTSDEEREWLDALEKGTLDDSGMLKKSKDPSLLTARQRALLHGNNEVEMLQLPSGYKPAEMTEEQLQRRQQRAKKRREQAQEKREKDKKQTLDRLLRKQDSKNKFQKGKGGKKSQIPGFRYLNTKTTLSISVPPGLSFPFPSQPSVLPKAAQKCGVSGCLNNKKYSCSKTGVPLCSLQCYKKNLGMSSMLPGTISV